MGQSSLHQLVRAALMEGVGLVDRLLASLFLAAPTAPPRASYAQGLSPPPETSYSPGPPAPLAQATLGPLVFLLRAAMVLLSLLTGPLQSLRCLQTNPTLIT